MVVVRRRLWCLAASLGVVGVTCAGWVLFARQQVGQSVPSLSPVERTAPEADRIAEDWVRRADADLNSPLTPTFVGWLSKERRSAIALRDGGSINARAMRDAWGTPSDADRVRGRWVEERGSGVVRVEVLVPRRLDGGDLFALLGNLQWEEGEWKLAVDNRPSVRGTRKCQVPHDRVPLPGTHAVVSGFCPQSGELRLVAIEDGTPDGRVIAVGTRCPVDGLLCQVTAEVDEGSKLPIEMCPGCGSRFRIDGRWWAGWSASGKERCRCEWDDLGGISIDLSETAWPGESPWSKMEARRER